MSTDDTMLDELLGAYALDAVDADEAVAVEEYLERAPRAADEVARLRKAAAWIGATEALTPPPELHDTVLEAATSRRSARTEDDPFLAVYLSVTSCFDAVLDEMTDGSLDVRTFNGLTVRELVIHLASMESTVAQVIGRPTVPVVTELDIERRTAIFVERFRDRPVRDVREVWRASVDVIRQWFVGEPPDTSVHVFGITVGRDSLLVTRAFETWTHTDDLRRVLGRDLEPPPPSTLRRMADLSVTSMPAALEVAGRAHPGKTARIVLTGDGGGDWLIPFGFAEVGEVPDVVFTADVVDWCRCVSERLAPEALPREVEGDPTLADDLAAASSAFATL
ncbi:MAG TPA: maleylpyruvate isomerase family mycothiol-dependent enzyme [Acidimicrobiia bacterium]|nr:maleylpyruvate isomerase family mycothiol-dependent enzyme [Acidimicrobiia bacterium]